MPQLNFYTEIDDHGIRRDDTGQIIARWWHPVASRVALDLPYWVIRLAPYRLIRMAIEMARKAQACFFLMSIKCLELLYLNDHGMSNLK